MTELSQKVLDYLRATGRKSFTKTDLMISNNLHLSDITAQKVISELEANQYIEINENYVSNSFYLL